MIHVAGLELQFGDIAKVSQVDGVGRTEAVVHPPEILVAVGRPGHQADIAASCGIRGGNIAVAQLHRHRIEPRGRNAAARERLPCERIVRLPRRCGEIAGPLERQWAALPVLKSCDCRMRVPWYEPNTNVRFRITGPPAVKPNWFCFRSGLSGREEIARVQLLVPQIFPKRSVQADWSRREWRR